tara:strand:- start:20273 stop:20710 length:438 start_codon:yes stop_codon:yes gene_type:complete
MTDIGYNPKFKSKDGSYFDHEKPFAENLQEIALDNNAYRKVIYTGKHSQVVVMSLGRRETLEKESHDNDQHFTFVEGAFTIFTFLPGNEDYHEEITLKSPGEIIIPANTIHMVVPSFNGSKFITRYSPPHHPYDLIQVNKPEFDY